MAQRTPTRRQMLDWVNMVSFAVLDAQLYLDTHPEDQEALSYFREYNRLRQQAVRDFTALYGPLTANGCGSGSQNSWEWIQQPWPWEGGDC